MVQLDENKVPKIGNFQKIQLFSHQNTSAVYILIFLLFICLNMIVILVFVTWKSLKFEFSENEMAKNWCIDLQVIENYAWNCVWWSTLHSAFIVRVTNSNLLIFSVARSLKFFGFQIFSFFQELDHQFWWFKKQFLFLDDFRTILFKNISQKMFHFRNKNFIYFEH